MANPIKIPFVQGDSVRYRVTIEATTGSPLGIDLSGMTIRADIRNEYDTEVVASFTVEEVDYTAGVFDLVLSSGVSASLPVTGHNRSFVFDVQYESTGSPPSTRKTPIYGYLVVQREVTRA